MAENLFSAIFYSDIFRKALDFPLSTVYNEYIQYVQKVKE